MDTVHWELWDADSGNLVGDYASEADALANVHDAVSRHGPAVVETLALGAEYDDDGGLELIARAHGEMPGDADDSL